MQRRCGRSGRGRDDGTGLPAKHSSAGHLDQAIEELRERVQSIRRTSIDFSIDETTSRTVIKVIDVEKDEVILQMPSERLLELAKFFAGDKTPDKDRARRSGLLIDERA